MLVCAIMSLSSKHGNMFHSNLWEWFLFTVGVKRFDIADKKCKSSAIRSYCKKITKTLRQPSYALTGAAHFAQLDLCGASAYTVLYWHHSRCSCYPTVIIIVFCTQCYLTISAQLSRGLITQDEQKCLCLCAHLLNELLQRSGSV